MIPDEQKDQRVCGDINNGLSTGPKMSPPLSRRPCSESHYAPDGRGSSVTLGPALDKTAHYNHAPSWHSTRLYGGDTSTPFFILRTGNIVGAGGEEPEGGCDFNNLGCFVHTRAGSEVFWLNSGLWKRIGRAARGVILTE